MLIIKIKEEYRRLIIEYVIRGSRPLVVNRRYMSLRGKDKPERRLQVDKNHYGAVTQWKDNLDWLEQIGEELIK